MQPVTKAFARESRQRGVFYRTAQLICCLMLFQFSGLLLAQAAAKPVLHPHGLLWKISKAGQPDSYLFGTIHLSDERLYPVLEIVRPIIKQTRLFLMEVVLDDSVQQQMASATLYSGGQLLEDDVDEVTLDRIMTIMQQYYGVPAAVVNRMKPWAVMATLSSPPPENNRAVLDIELQQLADELGHPVKGLETAAEQVAALGGMPLHEQLWLLKKTIEDFDANMGQWNELLEKYLARDLQGLMQMQQQQMDDSSTIDDRFMAALVDQRNQKMAERLQLYLQNQSVFTAIGALHLPGKNGVLHLLEQQGYTVKVVY